MSQQFGSNLKMGVRLILNRVQLILVGNAVRGPTFATLLVVKGDVVQGNITGEAAREMRCLEHQLNTMTANKHTHKAQDNAPVM